VAHVLRIPIPAAMLLHPLNALGNAGLVNVRKRPGSSTSNCDPRSGAEYRARLTQFIRTS